MVDNISQNLSRIKPSKDLSFKRKAYWVFPDNYRYSAKLYSPIFALYYKENPIGIVSYTNKPNSKNIYLNFIQGIKQDSKGFNYSQLNKPFYEIILDSFIASSITTGKEIIFQPLVSEVSLGKKTLEYKKKQLKKNFLHLQELETKVKLDKNKKYAKKMVYEIVEHKRLILHLKETINNLNNFLVITGKIRDRYFDKTGRLSNNKERVKKIYANIKMNKKKNDVFSKITKLIKIRKNK